MSPAELRMEAARRYLTAPMFHAAVTVAVQVASEAERPSPGERDRLVMAASVALLVAEQTPQSLGLMT